MSSGWKRISVILSVLWMLGAGWYTLVSEDDQWGRINASAHSTCFENAEREEMSENPENVERGKAMWTRCEEDRDKHDLIQLKIVRQDAAIAAFVPVPFAWGAVYLILFLVRWVKRGFAGKA